MNPLLNKISVWLCHLFLVLMVSNLNAQTLKFKRLGLADGLSQNSVYSIVQDQTGFIWIATANGLNRYDGFHFKVYRYSPEKPEYSLQQNSIWTLALDGAGNLWVGLMSRGLDCINATTGKVLHFQHQSDKSTTLSSNRIRVIYADDHGYVWVGTADAGLNRIDTRTLTVRRVSVSSPGNANGSPGVRIKAILNDRAAHLLIATDKALYRLNPRTLESAEIRLRAPKALVQFSLETIYLDRQGYLWLAPLEGGLWRSANRYRHWLDQQSPDTLMPLSITAWALTGTAARALQSSVVKAMVEDNVENLWVGSFTQGLFRITPDRKQIHQFLHHPFDAHSLSSNQIFSLMIDRSGLLWIGTNGGGVNILDHRLNRFQHFRLYPIPAYSLPDKMVRSVLTDDYGGMWVGTSQGGLARIDLHTGLVKRIDPGQLTSPDVRCLLIDQQGYLWFGTYGEGLWRVTPTVSAIAKNPGQPVRLVPVSMGLSEEIGRENWSLLQDPRGVMWVGTNDGLLRYDPARNRWRRYAAAPDDPQGLAHTIVRTLWLSGDSILWVGGYGGLHALKLNSVAEEKGRFRRITHQDAGENSPGNKAISALWEYPEGFLWIGTLGGGLQLLQIDSGRLYHWTTRQGLPSDYVLGVLHDDHNGLWISTTSGLARIPMAELLNPTAQTIHSMRIFTEGDGLQSREFNVGAAHCDTQGYLYFGGVEGLNRFHPQSVLQNDSLFPPVITEINIFDRPLQHEIQPHALKELRLTYRENFIHLAFSNLDYHHPRGVRYRYRLLGLHEQWSEIRGTNTATYTNLPPARYQFEVQAINADGARLSAAKRLTIVIVPAFWQTVWFRFLIVGLLATAVWGIFRYGLIKERELQHTRARIAADLHDEVASSLASIRLYSEVVAKQLEGAHSESQNILVRIRQQAHEVTESIAEIIWSVDPRHDRLGDLLARIQDFARQVLPAAGIDFHFQGKALPIEKPLTPRLRRALYLILKEAITNAMRHSKAKNLTLRCLYRGNHLEVLIEDDGCGLNPQQPPSGRGLENMRARAREIGAAFHIENGLPRGTRIRLRLKIT